MRCLIAAAILVLSGAARGERPTAVTRPWFARVDGGIGSPVGFFGATVGRSVRDSLAAELGAGLGASGMQISLLARDYLPIGQSLTSSWTLAAGPSLALLGQSLGLHVAHRDDITVGRSDVFYLLGLSAEFGYEWRAGWGGLLRVAVGGFLKVSENMSGLCRRDAGSDAEPAGCEAGGPDALPSGPQVARAPAFPYLVFGYGFAW